jgi:hypothetical protein
MVLAQDSLIAHLSTQFPTHTIVQYAGQIQEANKLSKILPAILVMWIDSPFATIQPKYHNFDIIIVTESTHFARDDNSDSNLQLTSDVASYLLENDNFAPVASGTGRYWLNLPAGEAMNARMILQDHRFTISAIRTPLKHTF